MTWFARIEEACAAFIERTFANIFPSDLEPAQIARKLVSTMEARTQKNQSGATIAPARYAVYVHASDFERLAPHRTYLEEEWAALLAEVAHRVGIGFGVQTPAVHLREDQNAVAGAIAIEVLEEPQPQPAFVLRLVKGMPPEVRYLVAGTTRVGRDPASDIFLVDPSVSRNHAVLEVHGDALVVRDSGSSNGTYVNGQRVQLRTLQLGDIVAFGKTEMHVEPEDPS